MTQKIVNFQKALAKFEKAAITLEGSTYPIALEEYRKAKNEVIKLYIKPLNDLQIAHKRYNDFANSF